MADNFLMTATVKYLMLFFIVLFVITGIIFISVGAAVQSQYEAYTHFLDAPYDNIPAFLIAIGVLIFLIAIFGCYGAFKENYMMILGFSILMIVIFILELSAGISGYVLRDRTASFLTKSMVSSLKNYDEKETGTPIQILWDDIQQEFECCGANEYTDWKFINENLTDALPISCCQKIPGTIGTFTCDKTSTNKYEIGCAASLIKFIKSHAASLGATGICISVIQFIGIIFSCQMARRSKYEVQ